MQLPLPFVTIFDRSARALTIGGLTYDVVIARHRGARRYVLRLGADGVLRLTVPRGASIAGGLRFAEQQGAWIAREHQRQHARLAPWRPGSTLWFRGDRVTLGTWSGGVLCATE